MKYEHDNHNTITLHFTERSVKRTLNSQNSQRANSKRKQQEKQQQHTAKLDERMKFKQCCQRQFQIYI